MPAALHEMQEGPAGPRPGSAHGRQLRAVALDHFHHDVQNVLLICKEKHASQGSSTGLEAVVFIFRRRGACHRHHPHDVTWETISEHRAFSNPQSSRARLRSLFQVLETPNDVPNGARALHHRADLSGCQSQREAGFKEENYLMRHVPKWPVHAKGRQHL